MDAHLDLAMNAMEWNRDLKQTVAQLRDREKGLIDKPDRERNVVSLPALREGKIGLVVATQIARFVRKGSPFPGWHSPEQAWAQTQGQLAWYGAMVEEGEMLQITDKATLEKHVSRWGDDSDADMEKPIGFILSLEGADSLVKISYLEKAYGYGLRALGPAHYGEGRYAGGTGTEDGFSEAGKTLLKEMDSLHMILDLTHLTDLGFNQAMEMYKGPVWASHHNVRKIVPTQRQLTDEQIKRLIERDAVIGGMLDCWALDTRFIDTISDPWQLNIKLENLVDHWDHICQLAGNSLHIAIGSDLDGIFGTEQSPWDMNSIADLQKYQSVLSKRGYTQEDIENIFHKNWLRFLRKAWS